MYHIHKTIKKYILSHLILCSLISLSGTLQGAASAAQSDTQESYDYTLQNHADQVSPIQEEAYLDIEEMPQDLTSIMQAAASKGHHDVPQLLAMVAEDVQNRQYYKYLFASNGLLAGSTAQQKAHNLNYHLVKAPAGPVIWQVLSFLDQKPYLVVKGLLLPYSAQLCLPCGHMAMHLFGKKLPVHKTGCQGQPFPTTAAPTSAIACFYSDRFTDQQQRLVISQIGDQAFPNPKKLITSQPIHDNDHHRLTSQPLTKPLPSDQLLIPANGQCLYTTVIMGYLFPARQAVDEVIKRMDQLFGLQPADYINPLYQTLENPTHYLTYLHSDAFGTLVTAFMTRMQIKKGTWGGPAEIQTIANKLKVNIQAYYPDPSNPTNLVQSDLTKPAQAVATITLHIVRDKVHPAEVLTQAEKASAEDNPHYQHYRLKYTLPPSISAPAIGTFLSHSPNNIRYKPVTTSTNTPTKLISAIAPKENNHLSDGEEKEKGTTPPISPQQSLPSTDNSAPSQPANDHSKDGRYTISNPLVLLTCAVEYHKNDSLPTVKEEMQTLYDLFKRKCGYEVVSTFFDKAGNIFPRHQEDEKEMDGKWLYKSKFKLWIDQQVTHLQQHSKKYDALIFIFSGHGVRDGHGRECIVTSDDKPYLWQNIEWAFATHPALQDDFGHKPKLFFKLACRNLLKSVINEKSVPVDKTRGFTFYATAEGKESWTDTTKELTNAIFDFFQEAIQRGHALCWIESKLKEVMQKHPRRWDAPEAGGGLITDKIFFKKKDRDKVSLPSTNNLPKLPHENGHMMPREEEIKIIAYDFSDGQIKQALIADGGLGKSTLARLYAKKYLAEGRYAHAWWFNAEDEATLAASIAAVNKEMGIEANDHRNMRQGMDKIKEKLKTYPDWLLIFDNAKDPSKLLINYLPKDTTEGHILITSRYDKKDIWTTYDISPKPVAGITPLAAKKFLPGFHIPEGTKEKAALENLLTSIGRSQLLPLTLAQIGYYLSQDRKDRSKNDPIYQDYLTLYEKEQKHYDANRHSIAPSIVITFTITANRIQKKIAQGNATVLKETWRILRVMSFLHPDGLDWAFFAHLRPSRKDTHKWLRGWVEDQGKTIDHTQAYKAATCLCDYGILIGEKGKHRAHRTVQEIMRWRIEKKKLTSYIQDQALQLLEAMQSPKTPTNKSDKDKKPQNSPSSHTADDVKSDDPLPDLKPVEELRFEMAAHCRTLMGYIHADTKKRTRLLRLMSQIDSQAYLRAQLYLPPQATNKQPLHKQVIQFVNGENPLLLLTADAGSGKSTYGCYLVEALWKIYYQSKLWAHIPLFISLPAYCTKGKCPPKDLITRALRTKGLNDTTISQLQQAAKSGQQPWAFVLDGYDEVYGKDNLFEACNLSHWGTRYSKYIITCRIQYLAIIREKYKIEKKVLFTTTKYQAKELSLAAFSPAQVEDYIKRFAESEYNEACWHHQRYQQALAKSPQLKAWMTSPFLLVISLQALPRLYKDHLQNPSDTITKADICEAFIKAWMKRELDKSQARVKKEAYLLAFCEELAYALFIAEKQVMQKHDPEIRKFFTRTIQLQSAPLRHIAEAPGSYQFIHPDFQDFFAASFILKQKKLGYILEKKLLSRIMVLVLASNTIDNSLQEKLWHYIRQAPQANSSSIAASNSVQMLCYAGHNDFHKEILTQLDLNGINLTKAKLPKNLAGTNFTEAKLPQHLSKHNLTHANLSKTNLTYVKLPKDLSSVNFTDTKLPEDLSSVNFTNAKLPKDLSNHNLTHANFSNTNLTNVKLPKNLSNTNLTHVKLPKDLSDTNLIHANLTGQRFTATNFEGTKLEGVVLTNTLCDYQQCFQDHIKANKLSGGNWFRNNLPKDLKSIAQVYPRLSQDSHKAELLQIASGLAYLPYWGLTEFYIKVYYWSCKLLLLRKELSSGLGAQLVCTLASYLEYDVENYCWQTDYPQHQVEEAKEAPHNDFDQYLKTFQAGLQEYNCQSKGLFGEGEGYRFYKNDIVKNIKGLQKTYPKLTSPKLQKEAVDIAFQLSKIYQNQHLLLLFRYLFLQNRLIRLKISAGVGGGNEVHYNDHIRPGHRI